MNRLLIFYLLLLNGCEPVKKMHWKESSSSLTGTGFYKQAAAMNWEARDSFVVKEILRGNLPDFLKKFVPVPVSVRDSLSGKTINAIFYVAPDYLSIGNNDDWARINITPYAAQKIADSLYCFLPTRKMVDDIYKAASIKLEPVPMYAFRDSTPTMWQHHLIIEGQRKQRKGLIAGIKKDIVISRKLTGSSNAGRVAIYGWHQPGGKPIQPLYTGHVYSWVDYSQGTRLVYRTVKVDGKWMDYIDVLTDKRLQKLLSDEDLPAAAAGHCDFCRYNY